MMATNVGERLKQIEGKYLKKDIPEFDVFDPSRSETLPTFLAVAEHFRMNSETWVPRGSSSPILSPRETWRVPPNLELPEGGVALTGLSYWVEGSLPEYKHERG